MRIARSHYRSAILENLDPVNERYCSEFLILLDPGVNHSPDLRHLHLGYRKVMPRRKAENAAKPGFGVRNHQSGFIQLSDRSVGIEGRIVVVEDKGRFIMRI